MVRDRRSAGMLGETAAVYGRVLTAVVGAGMALLLQSSPLSAQERAGTSAWQLATRVLMDPTTYIPALLSYESQRLDWKTSQPLFARGWVEQNPKFTLSGRANDVPISFDAGNARIRREALLTLQGSISNNLGVGIGEQILRARYPNHHRLIHILGWAERISVASYMSYLVSVEHFRQAKKNRRFAATEAYAP